MIEMLLMAAKIALPTNDQDARAFWLGAIGIRKDGAIVVARNGAVHSTIIENYQLIPGAHAEGRILRKIDWGGTIFVARVLKKDRSLAMSSPCDMCRTRIKSKGIKKVYYTINESQYGIWDVRKDVDRVYGSCDDA
jgi:cytidine deaminase